MSTLQELGKEKWLLLETRKRDGTWVGTPVNLVVEDGRGFFKTYVPSGKVKRLRNFPEVRIAPSTYRGRVKGARVAGRATPLGGESPEAARAAELLARKHPLLQGRLVPAYHKRKGLKTVFYELALEQS
ncbi:PPOX class F420-dependent oxidoreductase [Paractinoplanes rhizophilus]|uniref:PPOX class F420-dependent oxidoreductase n=1 Tax=Paractinoplanes rhizophilus TaxID=1416877 RepID=A0ABW2I3L4_9ACTN